VLVTALTIRTQREEEWEKISKNIMIASICVIGRLNNPLYLQTFNNYLDRTRFAHLSHAALDLVAERLAEGRHHDNAYLGLLFPADEFNVYGYLSNTGIKFVVVTSESLENDASIHFLMQQLHEAYSANIFNPFASPDGPITSKRFAARVGQLVAQIR
jgi:hypothetical protein